MLTAATGPGLRLGLARCCNRSATRRESQSAASDTSFLSHGIKAHGCHLRWLQLPGVDLHKGRKGPWASLTDASPQPQHEGVGPLVLISHDFFSEGCCSAGRRKATAFLVFQCLVLDQWALERESDYTGIPASCQFKSLSNFSLWKILCVCMGNINDGGGEKVKISFRKSKLWNRSVTSRLAQGGVLLLSSLQPFFQRPDAHRKRKREQE